MQAHAVFFSFFSVPGLLCCIIRWGMGQWQQMACPQSRVLMWKPEVGIRDLPLSHSAWVFETDLSLNLELHHFAWTVSQAPRSSCLCTSLPPGGRGLQMGSTTPGSSGRWGWNRVLMLVWQALDHGAPSSTRIQPCHLCVFSLRTVKCEDGDQPSNFQVLISLSLRGITWLNTNFKLSQWLFIRLSVAQ